MVSRYIDSGFKGLMRPDRPLEPGCGLTDAYCADSYEVNGDEYVAIGRHKKSHCSWGVINRQSN
jgi:hypothetical protein